MIHINSELVLHTNNEEDVGACSFELLPVTLNDLDKEDVNIVRSCIPGNETRDICFRLSYVTCSYTYI